MRKTVGKLLAVTFVMLGAIVLASPVEVLAKKKVKTEKVTIIKGRNQCFTFRKLKLKKIKVKYSKKKIAKAKLKKDVNCQTAHCGRYIPHFDFGAKPSPIVPYRHLPQSLSGMTADCRSLV